MSKRRTHKPSHARHTPSTPDFRSFASLLNGFLLLLVGTLITARYLLPAESASQGDTLHIALGWFVVAFLFACSLLLDRTRTFRIDRYDLGVWILVFGQIIATLVMIFFSDGHKRAALNMMWEWGSLGLCFSILRRLIVTTSLRIVFLQGLLATIVLLSIYGIWQHHWMYEQLSKEYLSARQNFDAAVTPESRSKYKNQLISMGVPSDALSGSSQQLFEDRLLNSSEPFGMFALANTFAGLLAVGFLIAISQSIHILFYKSAHAISKWDRFKSWIMLLPPVIIGYCLVLTKSRTAVIGVIGGLLCFGILKLIQNQQRTNKLSPLWIKQAIKWVTIGGTLLLVLFIVATFSGGFDMEVLTESSKSLRYRLEWWSATWDLIKESPVWGTGPGNFREHYLRFKLPGSSEEIADPHNLFLDVWANAGIIALIGLLVILILACQRWIIKPDGLLDEPESKNVSERNRNPYAEFALVTGSALAFPLLWGYQLFYQSIDDSLFWIFCMSWLAIYFLLETGRNAFEDSKEAPPSSSLIPLAIASVFFALSIHLLGAGGIAMPAITQTWLLLLALAVPVTSSIQAQTLKTIHLNTASLVICLLLIIFFVMTSFAPTTHRKMLVLKGEQALMRGESIQIAQRYFRQASQADKFSPAPWQALAELQLNQRSQQHKSSRDAFQKGIELKKEAIKRTPFNPRNYFELGQRFHQQYLESKLPEDLNNAIKYLAQAVQGYPNNARFRVAFAEVLFDSGQIPQCQKQAQKAIELDKANRSAQHVDKYLTEENLMRMNELINPRQGIQN